MKSGTISLTIPNTSLYPIPIPLYYGTETEGSKKAITVPTTYRITENVFVSNFF